MKTTEASAFRLMIRITKIDGIAFPSLISRFIDDTPEFLFVPADQIRSHAAVCGAIPYDVPGN